MPIRESGGDCFAVFEETELYLESSLIKFKNSRSQNLNLIKELLPIVKMYNSKAKQLRIVLDKFKNKSEIMSRLKVDAGKMMACRKPVEDLEKSMESQKKRIQEVLTNGGVDNLMKIKATLNEALNGLIYMMIDAEVKDSVNIHDMPAYKLLETDEARNFWIQRFDPKVEEVKSGVFAEKLLQSFVDSNGWPKRDYSASLPLVRKFVQGVVDIGGKADSISLDEFNKFAMRFPPLSRSFIKVACLFDQNGNLYDWFAPVSGLTTQEQFNVLQRRKWILRLSANKAQFTLMIKHPTPGAHDMGVRIHNILPLGHYVLDESQHHLYPTLVDLLLEKVPELLKKHYPDLQVKIENSKGFWEQVEKRGLDAVSEIEAELKEAAENNVDLNADASAPIRYDPLVETDPAQESSFRTDEQIEKMKSRLDQVEQSVDTILQFVEALVEKQTKNKNPQ
eukprot:TRINITY_DN3461_c0_g2_i1.p1 TRINITY_DN3461_c0_g2~~TRINITY_DN3461_c0_g2_i1.p1  ORF type:complete len:484 (-),score=158.85 TRINITY_DN3461_c0_g2_i1:54-1403(-)